MWQAIVFGLLGGVMGANGYPHFTRGITKKRYPGTFGNGPVPNLIAGWALLVIAAVLFYFAHVGRHPEWSFGAAAVGVLLMGLFHAGPGHSAGQRHRTRLLPGSRDLPWLAAC